MNPEQTTIDNPFSLTEPLLKRYGQFAKIQDNTKRFERIIELGKRLPAFPEDLKIEENQVKGCASLVYIHGVLKENVIHYEGWSNSHLVLGLLALLVEGLDMQRPETILKVDPKFIEGMGLSQTLTASRANGFINTFNKMQAIAKNIQENK